MILDKNSIDLIVKKLDEVIKDKDVVVLLQGDLASGKTTFVKEFVKYKNITDIVTSPTFSLQTVYSDTIYHYDIYNKTLEEFIALGLLEEFDKQGIHFVEWGDEKLKDILAQYGFDIVVLKIEKKDDKREYIIES